MKTDERKISPFMRLFWEKQQKYLQSSQNNAKYHTMISDTDVTYQTVNLFSSDKCFIYFISDVPHSILIIHIWYTFDTRYIWISDMFILWNCISAIFYEDRQCCLQSCQNSMLFFINGLICDIKNFQNNQSFEFEWKPMLAPLRSVTDWRFSWLRNFFLKSFQDWLNSVQQRQGNFTKNSGQKMFILWQTYEGLKTSVNWIIEATQILFWYQVKYVLTERFCKDPLGNWFGRQRSLGSRKHNPSMADFGYNNNAIRNQKNSNQLLMVMLLIVAWLP